MSASDNIRYQNASTKVAGTSLNPGYIMQGMTTPGAIVRKKREERGWSQADLAREAGISQVAVQKIERDATKRSKFNPIIAEVLGLDLALLDPSLRAQQMSTLPQIEQRVAPNARIGNSVAQFGRVPLRGREMGDGGNGFIFSKDQALGYVDAPERVASAAGAYAVYVADDTMLERFRRGEVVYVDPHRPPIPGDDVVVLTTDDGGMSIRGYIKRLISREGDLKVRQLNPDSVMTFAARHIVSVHLIVFCGKP